MNVNEFSKKVSTYSMMCIVVVSFMMGCFSFNKLFLSKESDYKWISTTISWTKTGERLTWVISTGVTKSIVLNTEWTKSNNVTNWESKKTNTGWTKSVLGSVYAGYEVDWSGYDYIRNQIINNLWVDYDTAEFTVYKCYSTAINPKHCIEMTYCVSSSESSIFKRCSNNNCMWIKPQWQLAWYPTLIFALDIWIDKYNKYWFNNTPKEMITKSHYCRSRDSQWNIIPWWCEDFSIGWESHWTINCKSAISKLNI